MRSIEELRSEIDVVDDKLMKLIDSRAELTREIVQIKKKAGLAAEDTVREQEIFARAEQFGHRDLIKIIYTGIFNWVKER